MQDEDTKTFSVYMHTNIYNNKKYVGITKRKPESRWQNGRGYKYNKRFYKDIEQYGWGGFKHEILFDGLTKEQACDKEIELISLYDLTNEELGYNIQRGGGANDIKGVPILQYSLDGKFIKEWRCASEAADSLNIKRRNISACCFQDYRRQTNGYIFMYKDGDIEEQCQEYFLNRFTRPVIQYDLDGTIIEDYDSIAEASNETDISDTNIIQCCSGVQKTSGEYIWKYKGDDLILENHIRQTKHAVVKLTIDNEFVEIYESIKEAAMANNIKSPSDIVNCCMGRQKQTHGFKWKYDNTNWNRKEIDTSRMCNDGCPVLKFDLQGNIIKEYPSMSEAARKENQSRGNMSNVCAQRNGKHTLGGYIFMYKDDYLKN